jgi:hypothetical protein
MMAASSDMNDVFLGNFIEMIGGVFFSPGASDLLAKIRSAGARLKIRSIRTLMLASAYFSKVGLDDFVYHALCGPRSIRHAYTRFQTDCVSHLERPL